MSCVLLRNDVLLVVVRSAKQFRIVLITTSNPTEAVKISRRLVDLRIAAGVNIVTKVRSIFRWKGRVHDRSESLLIVTTRKSKLASLQRAVRSLHSYEVPEILSLPVSEGYGAYLKWIMTETKTS